MSIPMQLSHLLILVLASGCSININITQQNAENVLMPGSTLELTQALKMPAYRASFIIQDGVIKSDFTNDQYYPYCRLEMKKPTTTKRVIVPGIFTVTKIYTHTEFALRNPVKLASMGIISSTPSDEIYSTIIYLSSDKNPGVELLACEHWEDPNGFAQHLSLKQIKDTLDGVFIINEK